MNRTAILFVLAVLLFVQLSIAQKTDIRGVVEDSTSGEKIPFATITVIGANRGVGTNSNGFYLIGGLSWGTYEITASSIGYISKVVKVRVLGKNPVSVDFQLLPRPVEVGEVVVIGGRKSELSEINTSTHVLGQQELQRIPAAAQGDLLRSLQILPGIVSSSDVTSKFYVRGGAGDQNLILFDGMKIYNPYHAFGIYSIFDPDIVRTAEVYTGSFPAGYGGRLSSVVNVQSQDGNTSGVHGNANINFISGKVMLEGPISGRNSWLISGRKSLFSDTFNKFLRNPPPISFYDLIAKANFGTEDYGKYSGTLFMSNDDVVSSDAAEPDHRWNTNAFSFKVSDLIQDRVYFETVLYSSNFSITRDAKQSSIARSAESSINDFGIRTDLTIYTESSDLLFVGFDVSGISYKYNFELPSNVTMKLDDAAAEISAWFRYQLNSDKLKSDIGVHSDILSLLSGKDMTSSLQPRVNLSYRFFDEWRFKLSFGIFTQKLITISNEDDVISLFEAWIYIPSQNVPEKAIHYTAGIDGNLFAELSSSIQAYYKDFTSLVLYNKNKQFAWDPDYVNGTGQSYGVETLLRYKYDFMDLYLSYTIGWTSVSINDFTYAPRYDRRHSVNLLNITRLSDNFDISFRWEYGTGYAYSQTIGIYNRMTFSDIGRNTSIGEPGSPYTILGEKNAARLPAYHRLDLTLTYNVRTDFLNGNCGINIVNVYNNKNILYYDRKTLQSISMLPFLPTAFLKVEF
ncbi:MAG: TonB-dependent receptor [Bacteroidota bacterium]